MARRAEFSVRLKITTTSCNLIQIIYAILVHFLYVTPDSANPRATPNPVTQRHVSTHVAEYYISISFRTTASLLTNYEKIFKIVFKTNSSYP